MATIDPRGRGARTVQKTAATPHHRPCMALKYHHLPPTNRRHIDE